jgi:3-oxoacyl-[acyl-carrier-protein] synthase II
VGAATPLGCSRAAILAGFRAGETALRREDIGLDVPLWFGRVASDVEDLAGKALEFLPENEREFARVEPGLVYGIVAAGAALQDAGFDSGPFADPWRVASTVSSSKGFLRNFLRAHAILLASGPGSDGIGELLARFPADTLNRLLARKHGFSGPLLCYPAACATGANSVIGAADLLRDGIADVVLAGSSECTANAVNLASFYNMGALSADISRPFHRHRNGFNAGEGAAIFVLERESDACRRGARVIARLCGWDYRSEAYHITAVEPGGVTTEHTIRSALRKAGWEPAEVEYINAHGTGTPLNDESEANVISRVFGAPGPLVSSLKAHIGHLLGASASVELALALIALEAGFVPPTLMLDEPDPAFRINLVPDGGVQKCVRRFMKLSLGFGGHIAALALERPAA